MAVVTPKSLEMRHLRALSDCEPQLKESHVPFPVPDEGQSHSVFDTELHGL